MDSNNATLRSNLSIVLTNVKRRGEAEVEIREAIRLDRVSSKYPDLLRRILAKRNHQILRNGVLSDVNAPLCGLRLARFMLVLQLLSISTRRIDTAAGVTPGIRAAWPIVRGRTLPSFWTTSFESPDMPEKSASLGISRSS